MTEIPPILLSAVVCEKVIFDKITGAASLINIIQNINAPQYPVKCWNLTFFCELTNGHARTKTDFKIVDANKDEKPLFAQHGAVEFKDVKQVVTLAINLQNILFPEPGEYRFQLFAEQQLLGERKIICRKIQPSRQKPNA